MMTTEQSRQLLDLSPEVALRNDGTLRFERGGTIYATDGRVGSLRQVVVDVSAGEITALVVDVDRPQLTVLVPPQAVSKTGGSAVYLSGSRQQFTAWLDRAPRFEAKQVSKVNLKALLRKPAGSETDSARSIARAGRDFIETGAPAHRQRQSQVVVSAGSGGKSRRESEDADRRPFSIIGAGRQ